jgi:hypothetical protein
MRLLSPDAQMDEAPVTKEKKANKKSEKPVIASVDELVIAPEKKKKAPKKAIKVEEATDMELTADAIVADDVQV